MQLKDGQPDINSSWLWK